MKKSFYCFVVTMSLTAGLYSCGNVEKSDLERTGLVGNIKSITTASYNAYDKFGEGSLQKAKPDYEIVQITSFDSIGNLLTDKFISIYDVKREYTTIINDKGQEIKWVIYDEEDDTNMKYGHIKEYDDKGNLLKEIDLEDDKITNYKNTYDDQGRILSQIGGAYKRYWEYDGAEIIKYTEHFYDMKWDFYYKNGLLYKDVRSPQIYWTYTYDEQNRRIGSTMFENESIKRKIKTIYSSTKDTAPSQEIEWDADGAIKFDKTYTYFTVGNDTVTIFEFDKEDLENINFFFRTPQNVTKDTYVSSSSLIISYQYIYENGNLALMKDLTKGGEYKYVDDIMTITEEDNDEVTESKYKRNVLISRIIKDKNGEIKYSYVVEGDDSKKTITIIDNGETKKGEEIYEDGKLVKSTDASIGLTSTVTYDKEGHMSEIKNSDGTFFTYKYDYDAKGNWIKKITYKNGKADRITERSIIYY